MLIKDGGSVTVSNSDDGVSCGRDKLQSCAANESNVMHTDSLNV